jgi:hypothetical protein
VSPSEPIKDRLDVGLLTEDPLTGRYARVKCYICRVIGDPQLSIIDSDRRTFAVMKTWSLPYT